MDDEHLSNRQLERYLKRLMNTAELLAADAHLAGCRNCREAAAAKAAATAGADSLLAGLAGARDRQSAHVAYGRLAAFVDGSLDEVEREIVESHIAVCGECKADWLDLEAFRNSLTSAPSRRPSAKTAELWRSVTDLFSRSVRWTPLRGAAAAVGIALLVWVASIPFRSETAGPRQETARSGVRRDAQVAAGKASSGAEPVEDVVAALQDGTGRISLRRDGSLAGLPQALPEQRKAVAHVLAGNALPVPGDVAEFAVRHGTLLGDDKAGPSFELTSPIGTALLSDRPTFHWRPLAGARHYEVSVYDSSYTRVAASPPVEATEWRPPRGLKGGAVYIWQVKAFTGTEEVLSPKPPDPEARFKVLDRKMAGELVRAQQEQSDTHMFLAILFAAAGALDDAERELKALAGLNPRSPIPRKLLGDLEAARRR